MVARVSGKAKASNGASPPPPHASSKRPPQQQTRGKSSVGVPVALTASNFESEVLQSQRIWLVEVVYLPI